MDNEKENPEESQEEEEAEIIDYSGERGFEKECQKCVKSITQKDFEDDNGATTIVNMPGYYHKRCKAEFDIHIVSTGVITDVYK